MNQKKVQIVYQSINNKMKIKKFPFEEFLVLVKEALGNGLIGIIAKIILSMIFFLLEIIW